MIAQTLSQSTALTRLRTRWAFFLMLCILCLATSYAFLRIGWHPGYALRWLALAGITLTYLLIVLWRGLSANYRAGENQLLSSLGWGNRMTLLRGALVAALIGFLFSPCPEGWLAWIPGILYTLADAADFLDGYLARVTNHATRLGEILDMSFDSLGVLAAATLAVQYKQVPAWYLAVALARFLFLGGLWLRRRLGKPVYELPASIARRAFAGLQMGLLAVMLWPIFSPPGTHIAATLFALPFLAGFLLDWLFVSGMLQPGKAAFRRFQTAFRTGYQQIIARWFPVGLRLGILALSLDTLLSSLQALPEGTTERAILGGLEVFAVMAITIGLAGRIMGILGLLLLGFHQMAAPLTAVQILLAAAYTCILFMGSGALSLWKPEDTLIYHRAGERQAVQVECEGS